MKTLYSNQLPSTLLYTSLTHKLLSAQLATCLGAGPDSAVGLDYDRRSQARHGACRRARFTRCVYVFTLHTFLSVAFYTSYGNVCSYNTYTRSSIVYWQNY